jgi:hypothetical protein
LAVFLVAVYLLGLLREFEDSRGRSDERVQALRQQARGISFTVTRLLLLALIPIAITVDDVGGIVLTLLLAFIASFALPILIFAWIEPDPPPDED